jgi:crossover junction endodeoxyribonuclease RuvC
MRILGIDPGTRSLGYGIIDADSADAAYVCCGALTCAEKLPMPERLKYLYAELVKIITQYRPDCAAIESPFFSENAKSALAIGKAQAVAILAAVNAGLAVHEYPPARIKASVAGFGGSAKDQVSRMVTLTLRLSSPPQPSDAADALACALCHIQESRADDLINRGQ